MRKFRQVSISKLWPGWLLLAAFALRLYRLGRPSLWYDESVSAFLAAQPIPRLVAHTARDIHPPGYYLLLHLWAGVAGQSEFALAFFSVGFGLLLVALVYRAGCLFGGRRVGAWAGLVVAFSAYNVWYSQEVRMYTLGAGLGLAAVLCARQGLARSDGWPRLREPGVYGWWLAYAGLAAAGLYTLYYLVFLLLVVNLGFLVYTLWPGSGSRRANYPALVGLLLANGLAGLVYLPWLPVAWRQALYPPVPPWRSPVGLGRILLESWTALTVGQSMQPAVAWPVLLLALLLFFFGWRYRRSFFWPFYTFGPLLLIYLVSFVTPLYHVRYLFTYSPGFYLLLGAGLAWLTERSRRGVAPAAAGLLVAASLFSVYQLHFNPRYRPDDYRAAVEFIDEHWQPGDVIVTNAGYTYTALVYYTELEGLERRRLVPYRSPAGTDRPLLLLTGTVGGDPHRLGWGDPRSDFYGMSAAQTTAALEQLTGDFARLWMLRAYDTVTDPAGLIRAWLAQEATPLEDRLFAGQSSIRVQGFLLQTPPPPAGEPVRFADGMALVGWQLAAGVWQPGQAVPVRLWWQAAARPTADYKMSLKLWDEEGRLAAQGRDEWPVGSLYRATDWPPGRVVYHPAALTLPDDIRPGQYWLNVELYHPQSGQPLARLDGRDPVVTLGPVVVE